jgi:hypothetical protein
MHRAGARALHPGRKRRSHKHRSATAPNSRARTVHPEQRAVLSDRLLQGLQMGSQVLLQSSAHLQLRHGGHIPHLLWHGGGRVQL